MSQNVDLDQWQALWQARSEGPTAADLRDRVERESHRRTFALILPVMVTVIIGGTMASRALASGATEDIVYAVETWVFIAVTWAGALWIDRGNWRQLGTTTTAFVDVSIRRVRATIRGIRLGACLYVGQLIAMLVLKRALSSAEWPDLLAAWPTIVIGWVGLPVFLTASVWFVRRKRQELNGLLEMRRQLLGD